MFFHFIHFILYDWTANDSTAFKTAYSTTESDESTILDWLYDGFMRLLNYFEITTVR